MNLGKQGSVTSKWWRRTIADGISVKVPGQTTFSIIKELIDDIVLVDDVRNYKSDVFANGKNEICSRTCGCSKFSISNFKKPSPGGKKVLQFWQEVM